jgi:hypothetical protein
LGLDHLVQFFFVAYVICISGKDIKATLSNVLYVDASERTGIEAGAFLIEWSEEGFERHSA